MPLKSLVFPWYLPFWMWCCYFSGGNTSKAECKLYPKWAPHSQYRSALLLLLDIGRVGSAKQVLFCWPFFSLTVATTESYYKLSSFLNLRAQPETFERFTRYLHLHLPALCNLFIPPIGFFPTPSNSRFVTIFTKKYILLLFSVPFFQCQPIHPFNLNEENFRDELRGS